MKWRVSFNPYVWCGVMQEKMGPDWKRSVTVEADTYGDAVQKAVRAVVAMMDKAGFRQGPYYITWDDGPGHVDVWEKYTRDDGVETARTLARIGGFIAAGKP